MSAPDLSTLEANSNVSDVEVSSPEAARIRALVVSGGDPYVLITVGPEADDDQIKLSFWGMSPEDATEILAAVAGALAL